MLGQGTEASLAVDIIFWIIAVSAIVGAVAVVTLRDVFRAALFLIVTLIAVAGLFVMLRAEFLAAIQLVIYVGAISVLMIYAIMMTRDVDEGSPMNRLKIPAFVVAGLFGLVAIFMVLSTQWSALEPSLTGATQTAVVNVFANTIPSIARLLIRDFVLAFEIVGHGGFRSVVKFRRGPGDP